jgi:hypothetical protein
MAVFSLANNPARLAARAAGQATFDPGYVCAHSHQSNRYVLSGHCLACSEIKNAKRKSGRPPGRPAKSKAKHASAIKAAKVRFNRPKFVAALNDYRASVECRQRNRYLNSLLKVPA